MDGKLREEPDVSVDMAYPSAIALSPDGRYLAGTPLNLVGRVAIMDASQNPWREVAHLVTKAPYLAAITFTPDGEGVVLCGGSGLQRWNRMDNERFERVTPEPVHSGHIADIVFSVDGARLTSTGGTSICEWDLLHLNTDPLVHTFDLSPGTTGALERWAHRNAILCELHTNEQGESIRLLDETIGAFDEDFHIDFGNDYRDSAWCFDVRPDGKMLATGHWDRAIRFWSLEGDAPRMVAELPADNGHVCDVAFSPDGTMLASGGWRHAVKLWDTSTDPPSEGGELGQHDDIVRSVVFSPDARWLASGDELGIIRLWDLESNDLTGPTLRHPDADPSISKYVEQRTVNTLEFSADSSRLLSADGAGRVIVWSVPTGEIIKEWQFPGWVWVARWSPDETLIATGNENGTVYLLEAPE